MGNKSVKFDIISNLPPELLLAILSYLPIKDVTRCTLVCQNWFNIIAHLGVFWKSRAESLGLTRDAVLRWHGIPSFRSPRDFYIAAIKYKKHLKSNKLISSSVEHAIPNEELFTLCLYANKSTLVRIQKTTDAVNQNCSNQLVVERVSSVRPQNIITTDKTSEISLHRDTKVVWAHVKGNNLYWISRCGTWSGYNLKTNQEVFTWNNPLLKEGHGITVTSCNNCSIFVASHWVPTYSDMTDSCNTGSAYSLQIVKLAECEGDHSRVILNWKLFQQNHNHSTFVQHDSRYWLRRTHILSCSSGHTKEDGVCNTHRLILQCDCCVIVQTIEVQSLSDTGEFQLLTREPVCINCKFSMEYSELKPPVNRISSEVTLSSDQLLMGQVFDKKLYVWKFNEQYQNDFLSNHHHQTTDYIKLSSLSVLPGYEMSAMCKGVKLAALGHILTIVAYLDDTHVMEYKVQIVLTKTGEVLFEFRRIEKFYNWTICCQIDPLHRFYFMCDSNSDWLNLVQCNIPDVPIVTVHNHNGKLHLEALQCNRIATQTWRKYWRCAINFGFRH